MHLQKDFNQPTETRWFLQVIPNQGNGFRSLQPHINQSLHTDCQLEGSMT